MYINCNYTQDHSITFLDNRIILNGQQNTKHDLKKPKNFSQNKSQTFNQPFYAMSDASNFGIGAALLQSHNGTNKKNLISQILAYFYKPN